MLQKLMQEELGLADSDFDYHASDLYVRWSPEVEKWLKTHYEFYSNIERFYSNALSEPDGISRLWFDIPFAGKTPSRIAT